MKSAETSDVHFRGLFMHGKECYKFISMSHAPILPVCFKLPCKLKRTVDQALLV